MCVIKILLGCLTLGLSTWLIIWWLCFNSGGKTKMGLRLFRQVYRVNPDRWSYTDNWYDDLKHLCYHGDRIKLSFIAFVWFLSHHITEKYRSKKEAEREYLISILECCQKDIDRIKRDSEQQVESALKEQKRILKNWK